jgi:hypothetical protein
MDVFAVQLSSARWLLMSDFDYTNGKKQSGQPVDSNGVADDDLLMERILENISSTPLGRVLKRIASLPEVRREKVLDVRRQLTDGEYNLNERLDAALEKVLEDIDGR